MVQRVAEAIGTEACSIYLVDEDAGGYRLAASVGFREGGTDRVMIQFGQGLVGLVAERAETLNVPNASSHPQYLYFPEIGEERYDAFLGTPIIHQRQVLGVLVVQQQENRCFDEKEQAFLVTISAQLSGLVASAKSAGFLDKGAPNQASKQGLALKGLAASTGVCVGEAVVVYTFADREDVPEKRVDDIPKELERLGRAFDIAKEDVRQLEGQFASQLPEDERALFQVYQQILNSRSIRADMIAYVQQGLWAPSAVSKVIQEHALRFEGMTDPYLQDRASDVKELGRRLLMALRERDDVPVSYPKNTILVGREITAAHLAEVPPGRLAGVVSKAGSKNAHVAILARAMNIPAVLGIDSLPVGNMNGCSLIVDGYAGVVHLSPPETLQTEYQRLSDEESELRAGLETHKEEPAITPDGHPVRLQVNVGLMADVPPAIQAGAEGVGLYRTEVPFLIRERFPTEEEQVHLYRELLDVFYPDPVTIRTLDVGGDKPLPYFPQREDNPYLGWRGIRMMLDHPEIFLVQLRAMLKASVGLNNLRILLPMISSVTEIEEAKRLIHMALTELTEDGYDIQLPKVGAMVEVPSAAYQTAALARVCDFLSVGSNDLIQYLLAVDRNNPQVAHLYDGLHPAVLNALYHIAKAARHEKKPISICGEMASDPVSAVLLLGLGYDVLSMSAHAIPRIKWALRKMPHAKAVELAKAARKLPTAKAIEALMWEAFDEMGLGGLIRPGK